MKYQHLIQESTNLTLTLPGSSSATTTVKFSFRFFNAPSISFSTLVAKMLKAELVLFFISSFHVKSAILNCSGEEKKTKSILIER